MSNFMYFYVREEHLKNLKHFGTVFLVHKLLQKKLGSSTKLFIHLHLSGPYIKLSVFISYNCKNENE